MSKELILYDQSFNISAEIVALVHELDVWQRGRAAQPINLCSPSSNLPSFSEETTTYDIDRHNNLQLEA